MWQFHKERSVHSSAVPCNNDASLTKVNEDLMFSVMNYLSQVSFKSVQVAFYSSLKWSEVAGKKEKDITKSKNFKSDLENDQ